MHCRLQPKPQPSPFLQSEAFSHGSDEAASPGKKAPTHMPGPRLQYRHSTGSGMQPLETSALQAGLQTMPHRIPPLPEMPPGEVCCQAWPVVPASLGMPMPESLLRCLGAAAGLAMPVVMFG